MKRLKLLSVIILISVSWETIFAQDDDPTLLTCPKHESNYSHVEKYTGSVFPETETYYVAKLEISGRENEFGCSDVYEVIGDYIYGVTWNDEIEGNAWCDLTYRNEPKNVLVYCEIDLIAGESLELIVVSKLPNEAIYPIRYKGNIKALWYQWPNVQHLPVIKGATNEGL